MKFKFLAAFFMIINAQTKILSVIFFDHSPHPEVRDEDLPKKVENLPVFEVKNDKIVSSDDLTTITNKAYRNQGLFVLKMPGWYGTDTKVCKRIRYCCADEYTDSNYNSLYITYNTCWSLMSVEACIKENAYASEPLTFCKKEFRIKERYRAPLMTALVGSLTFGIGCGLGWWLKSKSS
jgi:hypothetical protein